jgi:hypothetical protein
MPVEFLRDDERRRVRVTLLGAVSIDAMKAILDRQIIEGAWTYGLFYDVRSLTALPSAADAHEGLEHLRKTVESRGPRGPVALVARDAGAIGFAQRYGMRAGTLLQMEVFWDVDEAERWLAERS